MKSMSLNFTLQNNESLEKAFKDSFQLKYRTMTISSNCLNATNEQILMLNKIIENSSIEHLKLRYLHKNIVTKILFKATNITSLKINAFKMHIEKKFDFPNLKYVFSSDNSFLCAIGSHRIESLSISDISPNIFNFLETCNGLKELSISGFRVDGDREFTNFKLEKMRIYTYYLSEFYQAFYKNGWDLSECGKFLSSQRHSLKEIYIKNDCVFRFCSDKIIAYALNNMDLRKLHASHPILHEKIYKVNRELKDLKIDLIESSYTKHLIDCCPNVEKIDLTSADSVFTFMLPLVSKIMLNLKHLKILIYNPPTILKIDAELSNLISLYVTLVASKDVHILIMLIKCCHNIKYLILETPHNFNWEIHDFEEFLMLIRNVVEIRCKGDFGLTNEVFKWLIDKLENSTLILKSLKIEVENPEKFREMRNLYKDTPLQFTVMQKMSERY